MCLLGSSAVSVNQSVDAVLTAATAAAAGAATKAARRRVRQRMVKKLAPMIGKEDLQGLVAEFKTVTTGQVPQSEDLPSRCAQSAAILPMQLQSVYLSFVIPLAMPPAPLQWETQVVPLCAPQIVHQLKENVQVPCIDATVTERLGKQKTSEGVSHKREMEEIDVQVARTFVHFDTCAYERLNARRRSVSV
mmetsp:Transcript_92857/g.165120  ORF Transcript_92857/g.165120 Transcript_92857/m.165120 type:complete len:191 (+) Transcript_92857:76-648(+)